MTDYVRIVPINYADYSLPNISATSEETNFPVTNLLSNIRDRVWRSTTQGDQTIGGSLPDGPVTASAWGLWPGRYLPSLQVTLFDGTDLNYDSGVMAFSPLAGNAFGNYPGTEVMERAARIVYFSPVTFGSYSLFLSLATAPTAPYFEARRFWIGEYIDGPYHADSASLNWRWVSTSKASRAFGGSLRRLVGASARAMRFDTYLQSEADRTAWARLLFYCEPGREVVFSLFQSASATQAEDFTILGTVLNASMASIPGAWKVSIEIEES